MISLMTNRYRWATKTSRLRRALPILLCLALNGCVVGNLDMWLQVKKYSGDGVIHNCSSLLSPGYSIEFPKFSSASPYQNTYRINRVPQRGGEPAWLYLRFFWQNTGGVDEKKKSVTASFRITLSDTKGRILHSADFHLSNADWMQEQGRRFWVYDLEKSRLQFERDASYILNVSYTPGSVPPPAEELYFFIQNGCMK